MEYREGHRRSLRGGTDVLARRRAARSGMTLIEVIVGCVVAAIVIGGIVFAMQNMAQAADTQTARAESLRSVQRLQGRLSEGTRIVPGWGDLTVANGTTLAFRKRQAPSATVCGFDGSAMSITMPAAERAGISVGDSVAILKTDKTWAYTRVNGVPDIGCMANGASSEAFLRVDLPSPLPPSAIAMNANVRIWSTRRYAFSAASTANSPGGSASTMLTEQVNSDPAVTIAGPFLTGAFDYFADLAATTPAATASAVRLIRFRGQPYAQASQRAWQALAWQTVSIPISNTATAYAGKVTPPVGPTTAVARCTTPGATNYGDPINACTFPPTVAVASVSPNPANVNQAVTFDARGSTGAGLTNPRWVINGSTYYTDYGSLTFSSAGNIPWQHCVDGLGGTGCTSGTLVVSSPCSGAPNVTSATAAPSTGYSNERVDYAATASAPGSSCSVQSYAWYVDGVYQTSASSFSLSNLAAGSHSWAVTATNSMGTQSAAVGGSFTLVDRPCSSGAPSIASASATPVTGYAGDGVNFTASSTVPGPSCSITSYSWVVDGAVVSTAQSFSRDFVTGAHNWSVTATNSVGAVTAAYGGSFSLASRFVPCPYAGAPGGMSSTDANCLPCPSNAGIFRGVAAGCAVKLTPIDVSPGTPTGSYIAGFNAGGGGGGGSCNASGTDTFINCTVERSYYSVLPECPSDPGVDLCPDPTWESFWFVSPFADLPYTRTFPSGASGNHSGCPSVVGLGTVDYTSSVAYAPYTCLVPAANVRFEAMPRIQNGTYAVGQVITIDLNSGCYGKVSSGLQVPCDYYSWPMGRFRVDWK